MEQLPFYITMGIMLTTLATVFIFYRAAGRSKIVLTVLLAWLAVQAAIGLSGFYTNTQTLPPRFTLTIVPPLIFTALLFATAKGRAFIDGLNIKTLVLLHTIRIPVELILLGLFTYKTIPQLMTFEGRNFDILSGLTAPLVYYVGFVKKKLSTTALLIWNIACLILLLNIVINAVLAAPFSFQQFAFDQPNIAILYFPFVWLPACIVPLVLFSHLAAIRKLVKEKQVMHKKNLHAGLTATAI